MTWIQTGPDVKHIHSTNDVSPSHHTYGGRASVQQRLVPSRASVRSNQTRPRQGIDISYSITFSRLPRLWITRRGFESPNRLVWCCLWVGQLPYQREDVIRARDAPSRRVQVSTIQLTKSREPPTPSEEERVNSNLRPC